MSSSTPLSYGHLHTSRHKSPLPMTHPWMFPSWGHLSRPRYTVKAPRMALGQLLSQPRHTYMEPKLQYSDWTTWYVQQLVNILIIIYSMWIKSTCYQSSVHILITRVHTLLKNEKEQAFTLNSNTKFWLHQVQFNATVLRHETDGIDRSEVLQIKSKTELLNIHSEL